MIKKSNIFFKLSQFIVCGIVATFVVSVLGGCSSSGAQVIQEQQVTAPREHQVEIKDLVFVPATLNVNIGDTITWTNRDLVPHTATATNKSWDTGTITKDESKSIVISLGMETDYICIFHPNMVGSMTLAPN